MFDPATTPSCPVAVGDRCGSSQSAASATWPRRGTHEPGSHSPGVLDLLQDSGRFGAHRIGLTNGGPLDPEAFHYCNRLLANAPGSTAVEISFGGSHFRAQVDT